MELISAYDNTSNIKFLDFAEKILIFSDSLIENRTIDKSIQMINKLQCKYRKNCLSYDDMTIIKKQIYLYENDETLELRDEIVLSYKILDNDKSGSDRILNDLGDEFKEVFQSYPIFNIYPK